MLHSNLPLLGGRLSLDFVNATPPATAFSWERLLEFLEATSIISSERAIQLNNLPDSDPQAATSLLLKSQRLASTLRRVFSAMLRKQKIAPDWVEPVNEILRVTEGHDELIGHDGQWGIEFVARESGLDWLLAAVARSGLDVDRRGSRRPPSGVCQSHLRPFLLRRLANPRAALVLDVPLRQSQQSRRIRP